MNVRQYQIIQDLRSPRTARSEFRSRAKLPFRPMTRVNARRHDDAEPTWPECIAMVVIALAAWALFGWGVVTVIAWWLA